MSTASAYKLIKHKPTGLVFHTKPWKHQLEALKFLIPRDFGALYTDMGSGKTKIMIDLIINKGFKYTLIVAPKKVCGVWEPEFEKHASTSSVSVLNLVGVKGKDKTARVKERLAEGNTFDQLVIIINYDSIWRQPFKKFSLKFPFDAIICDESHKIKGVGSKCSRGLQTLGRRVKHRYLMTGTVLAQSPLDVYAQYRFLAPEIFGTNFGIFKGQYANYFQSGHGYPVLSKTEPYKNLDELHEKMFSCAFNMEVEEELPETQDIEIPFYLSPKAQKHYKELRKEGALELKEGDVLAGNVLAVMTRLLQISSGYLPVEDDNGVKTIIDIDTSRRDAFKELLEGIPEDEPVVVFAKYTRDIYNIRKVVKELGRKSSELSGKRDTKKNWDKGKTSVLAIQISSGAEGIDLTRARYNVYYTLTSSLSQYKQSRKRTHRPGQTRNVVYYKLIARINRGKTVDEKMLKALKNNEEIINLIMDGDDEF